MCLFERQPSQIQPNSFRNLRNLPSIDPEARVSHVVAHCRLYETPGYFVFVVVLC
jgi:hypothetical protein